MASSESLSASLRSTELRNLQQLVETPLDETSSGSGANVAISGAVNIGALSSAGASIIEGTRIQNLDLASSANTATILPPHAINITGGPPSTASAAISDFEIITAGSSSNNIASGNNASSSQTHSRGNTSNNAH